MVESPAVQEAPTNVTAFKPYLEEITLATGATLQLPRLTGKRIIASSRSVANLLRALKEAMPETFVIDPNAPRAALQVISMILDAAPMVMEHVIPAVADYLGLKREIVEDWDGEDIMKCAGPFFVSYLRTGNTLLSHLGLSPSNFVNFVPPPAVSIAPIAGPSPETQSSPPSDSLPSSSMPSAPSTAGESETLST